MCADAGWSVSGFPAGGALDQYCGTGDPLASHGQTVRMHLPSVHCTTQSRLRLILGSILESANAMYLTDKTFTRHAVPVLHSSLPCSCLLFLPLNNPVGISSSCPSLLSPSSIPLSLFLVFSSCPSLLSPSSIPLCLVLVSSSCLPGREGVQQLPSLRSSIQRRV